MWRWIFIKELDGETKEQLIYSLSNIFELPSKNLINILSELPEDITKEEVYNEVTKFAKNKKYGAIYVFHYTRCSDEIIKNIKKYGLVNAIDAMNYIFDDIYLHFKENITIDDYTKLVKKIKNIYSKIIRNPKEDNCINGLLLNVVPYNKLHFLIKGQGPELVCDVINEMSKEYNFFQKYHDYMKPYIIKIKITDQCKEKYLVVLTYYLYLLIQNGDDYSRFEYTLTFNDTKNIVYIKEVDEENE